MTAPTVTGSRLDSLEVRVARLERNFDDLKVQIIRWIERRYGTREAVEVADELGIVPAGIVEGHWN